MADRDQEAERILAELADILPGWGRRDATDPRGLARELLIASLVLDRVAPGDVLTTQLAGGAVRSRVEPGGTPP